MSAPSGLERILVRRASGVEIVRREHRIVAISDIGHWLELSPTEHRLLIEAERPRTVGSLRSLGVTPDGVLRLYHAHLLSFNGRMRPLHDRVVQPPVEIPRIQPGALHAIDDIALVEVDASTDVAVLLPAMQRGICVIPLALALRPADFTAAFERLAGAGFRLMRLEPAALSTDDEARALANGYLDMVSAALRYADSHPARLHISGLDGWLDHLGGRETPFVPPHPRCGRCGMHAICRPDLDARIAATEASCTYARTVVDGLLWMLIERPDLPSLLAGRDFSGFSQDSRIR